MLSWSPWPMCGSSVAVWIAGGDAVDEFTKADRDDWELEKAQDRYETGRTDWADLHDWNTRVEDFEAAWRADRKAQAERSEQLLKGDTDEWPRFW